MFRWLFALLGCIIITSCDDGDIITTNLDFPDGNLEFCGAPGGYLFFKTNDAGSESISLLLNNSEQLFTTSDTLIVNLNNNNTVVYRIFDGTVDSDYFCSEIPPTEPQVSTEYIATSGTAEVRTITTLADSDSLTEEQEGTTNDSDGDGLLDFFDFDDDGDNVPTILELDTENLDGDNNPLTNPLDTDGDGIPNYLDEDDDGDKILTINEDLDGDLDPTNDITDPTIGPDFLNAAVSIETEITSYREHEYTFTSNTRVFLRNFILLSGEEEINRELLDLGEIINILSGNILVVPNFPEAP